MRCNGVVACPGAVPSPIDLSRKPRYTAIRAVRNNLGFEHRQQGQRHCTALCCSTTCCCFQAVWHHAANFRHTYCMNQRHVTYRHVTYRNVFSYFLITGMHTWPPSFICHKPCDTDRGTCCACMLHARGMRHVHPRTLRPSSAWPLASGSATSRAHLSSAPFVTARTAVSGVGPGELNMLNSPT